MPIAFCYILTSISYGPKLYNLRDCERKRAHAHPAAAAHSSAAAVQMVQQHPTAQHEGAAGCKPSAPTALLHLPVRSHVITALKGDTVESAIFMH